MISGVVPGATPTATQAVSRPLHLGHIDLTFHAATAAVVELMLERKGHEVLISCAPHETMFERLGNGEVDMLVSAWLPDSHERYLDQHTSDIVRLGVIYRPYCIWGVPDYVPHHLVRQVADLAKPEVAGKMQHRIHGINAGAGISRFSAQIINRYGLDALGYHFLPGTENSCFQAFEQALAERQWIVMPLWHPQYLHHEHDIRPLLEPKGLLGGQDEATILIRHDAIPLLKPGTLQALSRLKLGNQAVASMDHGIWKQGRTAREAAQEWMGKAGL